MARTTKRMAALALSAALVFPASAGTATIGFAGYKGAETLTDFPALIKLPDCAAGFSYADAAADGADIYFTDSDGNVIPHDVDTWNASGASYVWVKVPALTAAATVTMHWGETLPANVPAASDTWTGYVGVWHMNEADGATATPEPDATGHDLERDARAQRESGKHPLRVAGHPQRQGRRGPPQPVLGRKMQRTQDPKLRQQDHGLLEDDRRRMVPRHPAERVDAPVLRKER